MNLQQIIDLTRKRIFDGKGADSKKLFSDEELTSYGNDTEQEIARQLECLKDSDTIGYLTLAGTSGSVDSVSVSSVAITSAAVPYATSLTVTAANLAANINAYTSTPNYRAVARGVLVIIKAMPNTGYPAAGYSLTSSTTTMTAAATDLPDLCRDVLAVGQRFITQNEKILRITRFKPSAQARPITLTTKEIMDARYSDWETCANGTVSHGIPDYDMHETIVYPPSDAVELIEQDVIRLPLSDMSVTNLEGLPEIDAKYHTAMVERMMALAYMKRDVMEVYDPVRANAHMIEFNRRIEGWKQQKLRALSGAKTNSVPGGLM